MRATHGRAALCVLAATALAPSARAGHAELVPADPPVPAWQGELGAPTAPSVAPPPLPDADRATVYGYHPYWGVDPTTLDFDRLTHLAIFGVEITAAGGLSGTSTWTDTAPAVVPLAHAAGVRVHLTVLSFDEDVHAAVLPSASKRAAVIAELVALVTAHDADGVSVDIEGLDHDHREALVAFTAELKAALPEGQDEIVHATPAVDWSDAYDYAALCELSDLFIMGYGYHWSGGDPGPVAPLYGGDPWPSWSLDWSVRDYRAAGAPDDCIILGLPTYGREWPVTAPAVVPGDASGSGSAWLMSEAVPVAAAEGRRYDTATHTPYVQRSGSQLWYDDTDSLADKISWAVDQELQGVGFWALGYEGGDPAFWAMVEEETARPAAGSDTGSDTGSDPGGGGADGGGTAGEGTGDDASPRQPKGQREGPASGCATAPTGGRPLRLLLAVAGLWGIAARRRH